MKTLRLDVTPDMAKRIVSEYEKEISEKIRGRAQLELEISTLQENIKSLRDQIQAGNGDDGRKPTGENKSRVIEYLQQIPDNTGAKLVEIAKSTGISISSVNFTLMNKNNAEDFVKVGKLWKLKK